VLVRFVSAAPLRPPGTDSHHDVVKLTQPGRGGDHLVTQTRADGAAPVYTLACGR
jgi:hypothetical protein